MAKCWNKLGATHRKGHAACICIKQYRKVTMPPSWPSQVVKGQCPFTPGQFNIYQRNGLVHFRLICEPYTAHGTNAVHDFEWVIHIHFPDFRLHFLRRWTYGFLLMVFHIKVGQQPVTLGYPLEPSGFVCRSYHHTNSMWWITQHPAIPWCNPACGASCLRPVSLWILPGLLWWEHWWRHWPHYMNPWFHLVLLWCL